jgi:RecA-family ATPase
MDLFDVAAEQLVLGAMMLAPAEIDVVCGILTVDDFYRPAHQLIFENIVVLVAAGAPADTVAVHRALNTRKQIREAGGAPYLHTLIAAVPVAANAGYYARIVAELAARRRLQLTAQRLMSRASEALDADVATLLNEAQESLTDAARLRGDDDGVMNIADFAEAPLPFGKPVIPGFLDQQERLVLVAPEGIGKSELGIQAAVMTAAGRHVFTDAQIDPQRTLYADLENPSGQLQRRVRRMLRLAERYSGWDADRCWIWSKPGGIDLRLPRDRQLVLRVIERANPALLVAGSLYKMTQDRGERAEQLYSSVTGFFDQVRERFGCAIWLETHAPLSQGGKRDMRPVGSGLWLRWPEYGMGLTESGRTTDPPGTLLVNNFRGHRDATRVWPEALFRAQPWSWAGKYPAGTFTP